MSLTWHAGPGPSRLRWSRAAALAWGLAAALGIAPAAWAAPDAALAAQAAQLALDKGCYGCHGATPRGSAPSMKALSEQLARKPGADPAAQQSYAQRLVRCEGMTRVGAHQQLSVEEAGLLVRWLAAGGH